MASRRDLQRTIAKYAGIFMVCLGLPLITTAQTNYAPAQHLKANIWYFGDKAGLDFSLGHPTAITNSQMQAFEGTAAVSDDNGKVLFYTNGGSLPYTGGIWNRNHQLMPNGNMATAGGCGSSFQSSLIVPLPRSNGNLYYLFTTDCIENNAAGGLRYNIVDMNMDGGLGDVVVKGQQLTTRTDESMAAIQHANGMDFWIVTHKVRTDSFYVYLLDHTGISGVIKQKIGKVTPDYAGTLKAANNGEKVVYSGLNWTSLFDFDAATGMFSNHVDLQMASYSAAFSPNCQYLYLGDGIGKKIWQFNLYHYAPATTKIHIGTTTSLGIGSIELGPDGRIYVARFTTAQYLGVITNPDYDGTQSGYIDNGIHLGGKNSKGGLPSFPNSWLGACTSYPSENHSDHVNHIVNLRISHLEATAAQLNWEAFAYQNFLVLSRPFGEKEWKAEEVTAREHRLTDLQPNMEYEIRVVPITNSNNFDFELMTDHITDVVIAQANGQKVNSDHSAQIHTPGLLEFDVYPNPTQNYAKLSVNVGDEMSTVTMRVIDMNGRVIEERNYTSVEGVQQFDLNFSGYSNGIYNIYVASNNVSSVKKLVVMK
ncbi:hypothetical protein BH09BAC1_BH09BAC1_22360 [soil metagenome]